MADMQASAWSSNSATVNIVSICGFSAVINGQAPEWLIEVRLYALVMKSLVRLLGCPGHTHRIVGVLTSANPVILRGCDFLHLQPCCFIQTFLSPSVILSSSFALRRVKRK